MEISDTLRAEYPRPQWMRKDWINLNGKWSFEIDFGKSGLDRKFYEKENFNSEITVPFCPESKLSGVEYKDFIPAIWYKREFTLPSNWLGKRKILHFGAVDYETKVWINGKNIGEHRGGYTSFSFDITKFLVEGCNSVVVYAEDDTRSSMQPRGKQSENYFSSGCDYTRTTGIWQTVWIEALSKSYIESAKFIPNIEDSSLSIEGKLQLDNVHYSLKVQGFYEGRIVGEKIVDLLGNTINCELKLNEKHLWEPGNGRLYDLKLYLLKDNEVIDEVDSYFGLRKVSLSKDAILINNMVVFQRLVLDQGFYPEGIYTAPSDEALKKDIEISMGLGFNGARLHQKVFEPRYLYWADKLGYLAWGEYGNWGIDISNPMALENFLPEWMESVERDFNSPALIGWCPFNETWDKNGMWGSDGTYKYGTRQDDNILSVTYRVTKAIDSTRPVIDTSGNFHVVTDIFDIHDYEQDVNKFALKFSDMNEDGETYVTFPDRQKYEGQPYFVSEYGGIWWDESNTGGWGYGSRPANMEEFLDRYKGLTETLLKNKRICAFCYTQLYDVEQEVNGLYTYQREPKFPIEIIKKINSQEAAIEKLPLNK